MAFCFSSLTRTESLNHETPPRAAPHTGAHRATQQFTGTRSTSIAGSQNIQTQPHHPAKPRPIKLRVCGKYDAFDPLLELRHPPQDQTRESKGKGPFMWPRVVKGCWVWAAESRCRGVWRPRGLSDWECLRTTSKPRSGLRRSVFQQDPRAV